MPLVTLGCAYEKHSGCTSTICECDCHSTVPAKKAKAVAREAAHQAVKGFDIKPDLAHTKAAIEALTEYEQHLKEDEDRG